MYKVTIFRLDGQYAKEFSSALDAVLAFEEVLTLPDDKRVCLLLSGPDSWEVSYE